jgi:hypothetical protein
MKRTQASGKILLAAIVGLAAMLIFALSYGQDASRRQGASSASPTSGATDERSFDQRCAATGVLICEGFDLPSDFVPAQYPGSGLYPGSCPTCDFRDTSIKASGLGSYRMEIPGRTGSRPSGNWVQRFNHTFGENSTFYVSFSFRPDRNWMTNDWEALSGTSPKIVIFHNYKGGTCAATEITTVNAGARGYLTGYLECGKRGLYTNEGNPPYQLEQGQYPCWWNESGPSGKCWYFHPEEWSTLYYKVSIGTWGKPNSTVEAWVARQGQKMEKWIDLPKFVLHTDSEGFDALTLTQYMTNKDPKVDHPTAYAWYDDLIISAGPIPPPNGPPPVSRVP